MNLDVSLSSYLQDLLTPLQPSLPPELAGRLAKSAVGDENTISYDVLLAISQWTRTTPGQLALSAHEPPLRSTDYTMISLLAGCITSPNSKFPEHVSTEDERETEGRRKTAERRAIASLVNASLSVVGSGVATWWVAGARGWVVEWRALLALGVALVVALSEGVLYTIWHARMDERKSGGRNRKHAATRHPVEQSKRDDGDPALSDITTASGPSSLRHRTRPVLPPATS